MSVTSWDDFPVHQSANWIAHPATSDRNFYDRYYFNAFDTGGQFMAVFGLGQYPNLGTTDAFVTVRLGEQQHVVRASRPLGDRADMQVGPLRVEVLEQAERVWHDGRIEQLGRAEHDHRFVPGTRLLARSTISFPDAGFDITCESILPSFIAVGTGYGLEADWRHGMYQGPETVVQGFVHQVADIAELGGLALVDHSGSFSYTDDRGAHSGFGLYEHSFSGSLPKYNLT